MSTMSLKELDVGDALPNFAANPITADQIKAFATASGDTNPIHIDDAAAKAAGFPGVITHGMLNMAMLGRLLTSWAPQRAIRRFETRFVSISLPGDTITCGGTVSAKRLLNGETLMDIAIEAKNQNGDTILSGTAVIAAN